MAIARRRQTRPRSAAEHTAAPPQSADAPSWETVLNSIGDALILVDTAGRITFCNPVAEQLLGRAQTQLVGRTCHDVLAATPAIAEMVARTIATGQTQARTEELGNRHTSAVPARLNTSAIWDHAGRICGAVLTLHDLSYQRTFEEDARLAERLSNVGTLVAGLAHEVKNPLGGIKGAAQLLALRFGDRPEVKEYTGVIVRETDRLTRLVDELLMAGSPRPPELKPLNIHKVIQDVLALVRPELEAAGIALREEFDPSLPETRGDAAQLTQVLLNLVTNAIEAMRSTPAADRHTLTVLTRMETDFHVVRAREGRGKFLRVEVADTGPGLPPTAAERLFELFYTTKPRGTGLGLAICQRILAAHHGTIRLENRRRGGAVSTLNLPLNR